MEFQRFSFPLASNKAADILFAQGRAFFARSHQQFFPDSFQVYYLLLIRINHRLKNRGEIIYQNIFYGIYNLYNLNNKQMRKEQRRYNPNKNRQFRDTQPQEFNQRRQARNGPRKFAGGNKFKPIQRNRRNTDRADKGKEKRVKKTPATKDDLDREMRQYWVKVGSKEKVQEMKHLASEKMNEEMDEYWKKNTQKQQKDKEQTQKQAA